jgi:signal transduction histidine kinase
MAHIGDPNGAGLPRAAGHITLELSADGQAMPYGGSHAAAQSWMLQVPPELIENGSLTRLVERALREGAPTELPRIDVAGRETGTWFARTIPRGHGGLLLELVDITESVSSVRRAERERGLLILGQFAHQFRNPLAGMLGAMQVFEADLPKNGARAAMAEGMIAQGFHLNRLVSDLVLIAREPDVRIASFSMRECVESVVALLAPAPRTPVRVQGTSVWHSDARLISRVLEELLKNASEATAEDGYIEVTIDDARIEIRDTGCGVPPEIEAEMFEPMFSTLPNHLGLGLAVAERFCRSLNLALEYERQTHPSGSLFVITAQ